jgi:phosphoenolpyruvate carboxykinase (ATP)
MSYKCILATTEEAGEMLEQKLAGREHQQLSEKVLGFVKDLKDADNVENRAAEDIRRRAEKFGVRTVYGNYNFVSTVKNRSAWLTVYIGSSKVLQKQPSEKQKEILKRAPETIENVHEYLKKCPIACVDMTMGDNPYFNPRCTLFVSVHRKEMIRLAYMVGQTLFPLRKDAPGPKLYIVFVPEWQEKDRQVLVFPEVGVTYVLGSDYYGEAKKGFLRMAMWAAKENGMIGVHAGAKIAKAIDRSGKLRRYSMILFGLSATGKTTHACHNHGLMEDGEGQEIVQDDVVFLRRDGSALGSERGFYLKTGYLDPKVQPILYRAAISHKTIFENVMVDYLGNVSFDNTTLTENSRGIIQRDDLGADKSETVNLPPLDELDGMIIIFITRRNTVVPIVSKLTVEQAAATFMLGESVETSAGDPSRAGESVREVGTNPFIIGDEAVDGNWFYEFAKKHSDKVQCYFLNTGGVGEIREGKDRNVKQPVLRTEIPETAAMIRGILRNTVEWQKDTYFNTLTPKRVNGLQMTKFNVANFYTEETIKNYVDKLKKERSEWLNSFENLNQAIVQTIKL